MEYPTEHECKLKFAYFLYKCKGNAFDAMGMFRIKFPWVDDNFAIQYSKLWPVDDIVEQELQRLKVATPTKEEVINYAWERAQKADDNDAPKFLKVLCDAAGFVVKVSTSSKGEGSEDTFDDSTVPPLEPVEPLTITEGVENGELQSEVS